MQGVNFSLPQTAYVKFIDVWLLFCLITPFIVFLLQVYWEIYRYKMEDKLAEKKFSKNKWLCDESKIQSFRIPYQGKARVAIISLTVMFTLGYIAVACAYYFNLNI